MLTMAQSINGTASRPNGMVDTKENGSSIAGHKISELDASKLVINLAPSLKPLPPLESSGLAFGQTFSDHMLVATFDPVRGWSAPEIKPHGPLSLDPASSCLQYGTVAFEGMKCYLSPDGKANLFRPNLNMARLTSSVARLALPPFDTGELLQLIKKLIQVDFRWIPKRSGFSLYVRPTVIGTRPSFGVAASDSSLLCIILSPAGPFFPTGLKPISLLAFGENVRAWPGGTGAHKLGLNYSPTFLPGQLAAAKGYQQILWLLGDDKKITEAGAMNFFLVRKREDGGLDVITPALDGTILPGVTRNSVLALTAAHPSETTLPGLSDSLRLYPQERTLLMSDLLEWSADGTLVEVFLVGTAAVVAPVNRIGFEDKDVLLPEYETLLGPVGNALRTRIIDIQEGRVEWRDWSVSV